MSTPERIESILRERLRPVRHFRLRDDSAKHVGHPGATSGGGHYHVVIVSQAFDGKSRLDQHRLVNDALRELIGGEVHALGLSTYSPTEWEARGDAP